MNKINKKEIQLELPEVTISGYQDQLKYSTFENYLKDNTQAWKLKKDGTYKLVERKGSSYSAQEKMLKKFE